MQLSFPIMIITLTHQGILVANDSSCYQMLLSSQKYINIKYEIIWTITMKCHSFSIKGQTKKPWSCSAVSYAFLWVILQHLTAAKENIVTSQVMTRCVLWLELITQTKTSECINNMVLGKTQDWQTSEWTLNQT